MARRRDHTGPRMNVEIVPATRTYYDRLSLGDAVQIARERIEEWDYEQDPHGYCHERPVLVRLVEALER